MGFFIESQDSKYAGRNDPCPCGSLKMLFGVLMSKFNLKLRSMFENRKDSQGNISISGRQDISEELGFLYGKVDYEYMVWKQRNIKLTGKKIKAIGSLRSTDAKIKT